MNRRTLAIWQLSMLTTIHFTVDMLSGMLPGFLPRLLEKYTLSIGTGTLLLTLCAFSSNGVQLWAGTLRKTATRPLLVQVGLVLGCAICLVGLVPAGPGAMWLLTLIVLVLGVGVALVHPEGLRGVCAIDPGTVTPAVATSIFMLSGFLGYATGPLLGGVLLECFGFHGLYLMLIPVALLLVGVSRARVRLAKDRPQAARGKAAAIPHSTLTFWELFVVATLINTGCVIIQGLLPTYLNLFGFSLGFGGLSAMLFGAGAGLGALGTSFLIKKFETIRCIQLEILAGVPLLILYLCAAPSGWAAALIPLAGVLVGAGFPQLVVLARTAPGGPALGTRMGLVVGGTWGIAGLLLLLVGVAADRFGLRAAMFASPFSFLCVLLMTRFLQMKKHRNG